MPVKSQAQRELLNAKFGHDWVKRHHFANKGKLPMHKKSSKEKKMEAIDSKLDSLIKFQNEEEEDPRHPYLKGAAIGTAGLGAGVGGTLLHRAVGRTGGYGANIMAMRRGGQDLLGQATGNIAEGTGAVGARLAPAYRAGTAAVGAGANVARSGIGAGAAQLGAAKLGYGLERAGIGAVGKGGLGYKAGGLFGRGVNLAGKLARPLLGRFGLESKDRPVIFESAEEPIEFGTEILGPWHGKTGHTSKIDQLEFPSGPSPLQLLRFPLPALMAYMNKRNLQQQVFSWKQERLINLNAKLPTAEELDNMTSDELREQAANWPYGRRDRSGKTWKGGLAVAGGVGVGYGGYRGVKALHPLQRVQAGAEAVVRSGNRIGGQAYPGIVEEYKRKATAFYKGARHAKVKNLSAMVDGLIEFDGGWDVMPRNANFTPGIGGSIQYAPIKKPGAKEHFKRNAGKYIGTGIGLGASAVGLRTGHVSTPLDIGVVSASGLLGGSIGDSFRRHHATSTAVRERAPRDVANMIRAARSRNAGSG